MARTTAALLAFAAIAGVAIAADDSNIGSRHAVDVKKVRQWSIRLIFLLILPWMWYDHCQDRVSADSRSSIRSGVQLFLRRLTLSEMSECVAVRISLTETRERHRQSNLWEIVGKSWDPGGIRGFRQNFHQPQYNSQTRPSVWRKQLISIWQFASALPSLRQPIAVSDISIYTCFIDIDI